MHDSKILLPVLSQISIKHNKSGRPKCNPKCVVAVKAYNSRKTRSILRKKGIKLLLSKRKYKTTKKVATRRRKAFGNNEMYKERNVVERLFSWIKECRIICTCYKKSKHFFIYVQAFFY